MKRTVLAGIVVACLAASAILHTIFSEKDDPTQCMDCNVILITVETARADHVGAYGYGQNTTPFIDSIAEEGVLFEKAYAVRSQTWPSLISMLTSRYPAETGVRMNGQILPRSEKTIADALAAKGYDTSAILSYFCRSGKHGFGETLCTWDDGPTKRDRHTIDNAKVWISGRKGGEFFVWMHLYAPHYDYVPVEGFDRFTDPGYSGGFNGRKKTLMPVMLGKKEIGEADIQHVKGLYDSELAFADSLIEELWKHVEGEGLGEKTILIVTSDHGEELFEHNDFCYHDCSIYDPSLHIPLIIRVPKGAKGRVSGPVENIDIAPTILDLLGLAVPEDFSGKTLVPPMRGDESSLDYAYSERYGLAAEPTGDEGERTVYTITDGRWRYIYNPLNVTTLCDFNNYVEEVRFPIREQELYDNDADPRQQRDVLSDNRMIAEKLRAEILGNYPIVSGSGADIADDETLARLRELGYIQ